MPAKIFSSKSKFESHALIHQKEGDKSGSKYASLAPQRVQQVHYRAATVAPVAATITRNKILSDLT